MILACALAPSLLVAAPSAAGAVTTSCGAPLLDDSGGARTCTFGDDFNGSVLNSANWLPMTTATTGFSSAGECYVNDRSHISVANGLLTLTATKAASSQPCGPLYWTPYRSGMVRSVDRFAQTYGRFEVRAKVPSGTGLHSALWMWPQDMSYSYMSGEIDIAEMWGSYPNTVTPAIHMRDILGFDHPQYMPCQVANTDTAFHTYAVEWEPTSMTFLYDDVPCMTLSSWDATWPLTAPQPFDKPFFMILEQALGLGENSVNGATPFPAKLQIDYVRAWR